MSTQENELEPLHRATSLTKLSLGKTVSNKILCVVGGFPVKSVRLTHFGLVTQSFLNV